MCLSGVVTCLACQFCRCCFGATINVCGKMFKISISRIFYAIVFVAVSILAWILGLYLPEENLRSIAAFDICAEGDRPCFYSFFIERMLLGLTLYHGLLAIILIGVRRTTDFRVYIHEAFLPLRLLALAGIIVGCLFIPYQFFRVYNYISMVGSFIFMIIQMILLIEFAYDIQNEWVSKMEDEQDSTSCGKWYIFLMGSVILLYILSIVICVLLYVFFTTAQYDGGCEKGGLNIFFITLNIVIAIVLSLLSVSSWVREKRPDAGLLQSSVFAVYCSYLVFSAISSEPSSWIGGCNKILYADLETTEDGTVVSRDSNWTNTFSWIFGGIITIFAVVWSTLRSSKAGLCVCCNDEDGDNEDGQGDADLNEDNDVPYNFTYFHLIYTLGSMYVSQLLTNWRIINQESDDVKHDGGITVDYGTPAVWIKIAGAWLISAFYFWTLIAPIVCKNREF